MEEMLKILSAENKQNWHEDSSFIQIFRHVWDLIYDHYCEAVKTYADEYLKSPAGIKFQEHVEKMRNIKHGAQELNSSVLRSFDGAAGIKWGTRQICNFWYPLCTIAESERLDTTV